MKEEEYKVKVTGMICPQCEDEISTVLLQTRGVISAEASYRKSTVYISYDPDIISLETIEKAIESTGYGLGGNGKDGIISDAVSIGAILLLIFAIPFVTDLVKVPQVDNSAPLSVVFLIGMLTGVHCIGMCGGIMLSTGDAVRYNAARIFGYTVMGALFGTVGEVFTYGNQFKSMLLTLCGLGVVITGLIMWGITPLRKIVPAINKPCRFKGGAFTVGMLTALMPCGVLSSMWLVAASSGKWMKGAAYMCVFGAGTCVFMLLFGILGKMLPKKYNKYALRISTILIVSLGIIMMRKGLQLL